MDAYRELCDEADRRGLRVLLSVIEKETGSKIERLSVLTPHGKEVAAMRVDRLGLQRGAEALLTILAETPAR